MNDNEKQYLIFLKYQSEYLHQVTGYSKGYLSRIRSGAIPPTEEFVGICCFNLKESQDDLFRLVEPDKANKAPEPPQDLTQDLLETIDKLADRLTKAEGRIKALEDELKQYS